MNYQSTSPLFIFTKFYLNHLRCPPEKNSSFTKQNCRNAKYFVDKFNAPLCHMTLYTHRPVSDALNFLINSTE